MLRKRARGNESVVGPKQYIRKKKRKNKIDDYHSTQYRRKRENKDGDYETHYIRRRYVRNNWDEHEEKEERDRDIIQNVLGYLQPSYRRRSKHYNPIDFEHGKPYGGLRLWSPERHLYLQHNMTESTNKRWEVRGEEPKAEW
jgi:hypothetical protein